MQVPKCRLSSGMSTGNTVTPIRKDLVDALQAYEGQLIARYNAFDENTPEEEVDDTLEKLAVIQLRLMCETIPAAPANVFSGPLPMDGLSRDDGSISDNY